MKYASVASENSVTACFSFLDGGCLRARVPVGSLVHPTDRLRFPDANKRTKKKANAAPCTLFVHASVRSETIRSRENRKMPIDRADCTDCFQQTKGDMVKIAATAETTPTIYNYWGGMGVRSGGCAEGRGW